MKKKAEMDFRYAAYVILDVCYRQVLVEKSENFIISILLADFS